MTGKTLYDKIWSTHVVDDQGDGAALIYVDRHLVHEVTSPQAFEGLKSAGRTVRRVDNTLATVDHNIPTTSRANFESIDTFITEEQARIQCKTLEENVRDFGLTYYGLTDKRQGIVHIIGPEEGFTLPGTVIVCGDSHTSTHGAFGALAFGIGTSNVEHVLATSCIRLRKAKNMRITVSGKLPEGCTSKDIVLTILARISAAGGTGYVIEYAGDTIRDLSMEARMSICNMAIEMGASAGMIAPDETTFTYMKGRPLAPKGELWDKAIAYWHTLRSDDNAHFDVELKINASEIAPCVTWGTSPDTVVPITGRVPYLTEAKDEGQRRSWQRMLEYMGLKEGMPVSDIEVDSIFIGSCTNGRIEDLRIAAKVVAERKIAPSLKRAMIVPGSGLVRAQAEREGLDVIFKNAGFDWRESGCSMCLGMNPDTLSSGDRCASTSNRNFESRQGSGGRTHLASPAMAAAAALAGKLADVRDYLKDREAKEIGHSHILQVDKKERTTDSVNNDDLAKAEVATNGGTVLKQTASNAASNVTAPIKSNKEMGKATGLQPFTQVKGIAAPLAMDNVDTDMLIPKQFLKTVKKSGLGCALFNDMRYIERDITKGENSNFVLNKKPYRHSKILVVNGINFGCGSSREHAPWALLDFGIRVVIAPSFANIFFNNMFKNGMLPVIVDLDTIQKRILPLAEACKEIEVDLEKQEIRGEDGDVLVTFKIDSDVRYNLLNGLDDIGLTLQKEDEITQYEQMRSEEFPWLDGAVGNADSRCLEPSTKKQKLDW